MLLEVLSTGAAVGTFIVITATAIAALVQLRHMRTSNEIAALTEFRETWESDRLAAARRVLDDVVRRLSDPEVRRALMTRPLPAEYRPVLNIGDLWDNLGAFVRYGMIDANLVFTIWPRTVRYTWMQMQPLIALLRRSPMNQDIFAHFEYLVVLAEDYMSRNVGATYPRNVRRLPMTDSWLEEDKAAGINPPM